MVTIVCMKWGEAFTASHVNTLYASVLRNMEEPFQFVCLTEDRRNLAPGIAVCPIPDLGLPERAWRRGCWPKLGVFAPHLFPLDDVVLFLDLDIMVLDSLAPFIAVVRARRHLVLQREWNPVLWSLLPLRLRPDRGGQSSVFGFFPGNAEQVFDNFLANSDVISATFRNDQTYLTKAFGNRSYWPDDFCVSFKRSCVWLYPFNLLFPVVRRPKKARILIFHGKPRPWETLVENGQRWGVKWRFGTGPVPWIVSYFAQADVILRALKPVRSTATSMCQPVSARCNGAINKSDEIIYLRGPESEHLRP